MAPPQTAALDRGRRAFLKTGVTGAALLAFARVLPANAAGAPPDAQPSSLRHLTGADAFILGRIVPVMLDGALPANEALRRDAIAEIVAGIDVVIHHQPPNVRAEIRDLFNLLNRSVTRAFVAGIWSSWDKASNEDVRDFLARWRDSRFDLLRSAYIGLNNLIVGSWYGNPKSWERIGYPGPPKIA